MIHNKTLSSSQLRVLHLMIAGELRRGIAKRLAISPRTVDSRIQRIKEVLGSNQRFCIGVQAARQGYVDLRWGGTHQPAAADGRPPDSRQVASLQVLAAGASVDDAAKSVGASPRTVRSDLCRLAVAYNASCMAQLGVIAEVYGWLR